MRNDISRITTNSDDEERNELLKLLQEASSDEDDEDEQDQSQENDDDDVDIEGDDNEEFDQGRFINGLPFFLPLPHLSAVLLFPSTIHSALLHKSSPFPQGSSELRNSLSLGKP
jgi:hypothetical protein